MLQRLYIHNFWCLENFEFTPVAGSSSLLIGRNGVGKTTVRRALEVLQKIGRKTTTRIAELISPTDFSRNRADVPMRFEIEVLLQDNVYQYTLALELPERFKELRVLEERLSVNGTPLFERAQAQVNLHRETLGPAQFLVDWHMLALPIIQDQSTSGFINTFRTWLARMVILSPVPSNISGTSKGRSFEPERDASNLGDWLNGLLGAHPAAYSTMFNYLKNVMPDLEEFSNTSQNEWSVHFSSAEASFKVPLRDLSDGEKCFFISALVIAANKHYGPVFCFWDEPDSHLSISEAGQFILELRRAFQKGGHCVITSHNDEAIRKFSDENTWVLDRKNHLEPTLIRLLKDIPRSGDLIESLICGDIRL